MKVALGTAQFGMQYGIANKHDPIKLDEAKKILTLAQEFSIDTIDTASNYGTSEKILGSCNLSTFKLNTKIKSYPSSCNDLHLWVAEEISNSLKNLNIDIIDTLFIHHPSDLFLPQGQTFLDALVLAKEEGLFKKIGVSIYAPEELNALFDLYSFDVVQAPFNLVDKRLLHSGWLNRLSAMNVEVQTRSAFLQGLLLLPYSNLEEKFTEWSLFSVWKDWLEDNEMNALEVALAYPLSIDQIDKVIVGVDSLSQFKQLIDAVKSTQSLIFPQIESTDINLLHPGNWANL